MTLVFPNTVSEDVDARTAPLPESIVLPANSTAVKLPSSSNPLSSLSYDTTLAFAVPYSEAPGFLAAMQEIAPPATAQQPRGKESEGHKETRMWIMKAVKNANGKGLIDWVKDSWTEFVDLLKVSTEHKYYLDYDRGLLLSTTT
jgi:hydroxymethylglutaryl-CoA reductase (NADPH)